MDIYQQAKFSDDPSGGFFSPYARNCASKCLLGFFSFLGGGFFQRPTAYTPEPIFTSNTPNNAVPRKDVASGVRKQKYNIFTPRSSRKTAILDRFWRDNFRPKTALQWGAPT